MILLISEKCPCSAALQKYCSDSKIIVSRHRKFCRFFQGFFSFLNSNTCWVITTYCADGSDEKTCWAVLIWQFVGKQLQSCYLTGGGGREGLEIPEGTAYILLTWLCDVACMELPTNAASGDFSCLHVVTMFAGTEIPALLGPKWVVTNDPRSHATSGQNVKSGPTLDFLQI
jgi:hypothetical protein